jgi:hypothetical protein
MAGTWARTRAFERIAALDAAGLGDGDLRGRVLAVLREVIDFDAYAWLLTDPVTAVGAAPLAEVPCLTELAALIPARNGTDLEVVADVEAMVRVYLGQMTLAAAVRSGEVELTGPTAARRGLHGWLGISPFAPAATRRSA